MSTLRKVIREEMSKILKRADQVDLSSRERKDRMKSAEADAGDRWYKNESGDGNVREKLKQIVAEEYQTLRDEPDTSIEYRSGLRDFEINEDADRWWKTDGDPDPEKIEEAAEKATRKVLQELGEETFRARAENAQSKDHLIDIFRDMTRHMTDDKQKLLEIVTQAMSRDGLAQSLQYIDRQHNISTARDQTYRAQAEEARMDELIDIADRMGSLMGHGKLMEEIVMSMGRSELRTLIQYIDRQYDVTPVSAYEQPIGKSMR